MKTKDNTEEAIVKEILSGKYHNYYLVYNRKSTDDTANQKNSIKYQKSENVRFAAHEGLPIATINLEGFCTDGIISEKHSGFKEGTELTFGTDNTVRYTVERPKFLQLIQFLSKGCFKGVIILCWDRASRNKGDDTLLRKLMKAGVDVRFTYANYDKTSAGELHMDIDGMFAEHHSRVTREKVTLTFKNARARGLCTHRAPVGYLNKGGMEHKPLDPVRAPIIKDLYAMAATGEWSLADIARWAIEQGFTMNPMRRRRTEAEVLAEEDDDVRLTVEKISRLPTFNSVHKILTNPFYMGKVPGGEGGWIPSNSHEAIISERLFYEVQMQLRQNNKSARYSAFLQHPLRGIVRCDFCHRVYTPYTKKGGLYYGARCAKGCQNTLRSFNFDFITEKAGSLICNLSLTDSERAQIDAKANTDIALMETERLAKLEKEERRKKKMREDLAYLGTNRLTLLRTGAYTPETLAREEARLNFELDALKDSEDASDVAMRETVKDVVKLSELLENVAVIYHSATPEGKERIIRVIFSELSLSGNTLQYKVKKGFEPLTMRFFPNYEPIAPRMEHLGKYGYAMEAGISDNNTSVDMSNTASVLLYR